MYGRHIWFSSEEIGTHSLYRDLLLYDTVLMVKLIERSKFPAGNQIHSVHYLELASNHFEPIYSHILVHLTLSRCQSKNRKHAFNTHSASYGTQFDIRQRKLSYICHGSMIARPWRSGDGCTIVKCLTWSKGPNFLSSMGCIASAFLIKYFQGDLDWCILMHHPR